MKDVAVVYKYSALESYSAKHLRRHREQNPELGIRMQNAHDDHSSAFIRLRNLLDDLKLTAVFFERDTLSQSLDNFRLVISLGGDGTFINSSHFIEKALLLGVNSSPENSVGHYCRFNLKNSRSEILLKKNLTAFFSGRKMQFAEVELLRMQVMVQNRPTAFPVLNDALFCEENPAATSRYTLRYNGKKHHQKSSGLWVTTPTGSSAAYTSAGGKEFRKKELRFVVRELYSDSTRSNTIPKGSRNLTASHWSHKLLHGGIKPGKSLSIISSMMHGALYLDGSHHKVPIALGEHIEITTHQQPLRAIY